MGFLTLRVNFLLGKIIAFVTSPKGENNLPLRGKNLTRGLLYKGSSAMKSG